MPALHRWTSLTDRCGESRRSRWGGEFVEVAGVSPWLLAAGYAAGFRLLRVMSSS